MVKFIPTAVREFFRKWAALGGAIFLPVFICVALLLFRFGAPFERYSYDLIHWAYEFPFKAENGRNKSNSAVLILLDRQSHEDLRQPMDRPWDRSLHARLIDKLKENGAETIVMDILFDTVGPDSNADESLENALRRHGRVILTAEEYLDMGNGLSSRTIREPIERFVSASAATALASVYIDGDVGIRRLNTGNAEKASLSWKAAQLTATQFDERRLKERWINYYSRFSKIPWFSYSDILRDEVDPTRFQNKVAFVGVNQAILYSGAGKDEFRNPYTGLTGTFSQGVEVHAISFLNLVSGDWLRRLPPLFELALFCVISAGIGFACFSNDYNRTTLYSLAFAILIMAGVYLAFLKLELWIPWLILVGVVIPVSWSYSVSWRLIQETIQKTALRNSLAFHLDKGRVEQVMQNPGLLKLGGELRKVTIMFTDIADFSKVSSQMHTQDLFKLLNEYFEGALSCVLRHDGTVIKLIGDSIFAIWNAPIVDNRHSIKACRTALDLRDWLLVFDETSVQKPLKTRIGIHTGETAIGNVGSSARFDYTAIGGNVNLASRLEGLNKVFGTSILTTREPLLNLENELVTRPLGNFRMKGLDQFVEVYELLGDVRNWNVQENEAWLCSFETGLKNFRRRNFSQAKLDFEEAIKIRSTLIAGQKDGPSFFYLNTIQRFITKPPSENWMGEIEIIEK